jgi:macrolide-specific efflux system membrane fusion protein
LGSQEENVQHTDAGHSKTANSSSHWSGKLSRYTLLVMAVGLIAVYLFNRQDTEPASRILTATVKYGDIEELVPAAGRVQPVSFVDVGAQVSGQLKTLHVTIGQTVMQNQLLAEIDASVQISRVEASRASLQAEQAQITARQAALELAESNVARLEQMMGQSLASQADYDAAINSLASASSNLVALESQIARSTASLASDEAQLGYSRIYAPESGTVVSINMTEGQILNASQQVPTILRIADMSTMTARAEVSEADVGKLRKGITVYFTTLGSNGRRWFGEVQRVLPTPSVENNVVLYPVLFNVANEDRVLLPDMTAQVFFVIAAVQEVLIVPTGALSNQENQSANVQVVTEDESLELRRVRLGLVTRVTAEIIEGLEQGEKVAAVWQNAVPVQADSSRQ